MTISWARLCSVHSSDTCSCIYISHGSFMCVAQPILILAHDFWIRVTLPHVWHASLSRVIWLIQMCVTRLIHMRETSPILEQGRVVCAFAHLYVSHTKRHLLIYMCHMSHSCVWHDPCISLTWLMDSCDSVTRVTCLTHMCDMTHSHVCDMTHGFVWLSHTCDKPHSYVRHDPFTRVRHDSFVFVPWHMCDMTHSYI